MTQNEKVYRVAQDLHAYLLNSKLEDAGSAERLAKDVERFLRVTEGHDAYRAFRAAYRPMVRLSCDLTLSREVNTRLAQLERAIAKLRH